MVVRHDTDDDDLPDQQHRRQWDNQDVSHLLSMLDNAELSSSCSASCSASVSQASCATEDDAVDTVAVPRHSPDPHVVCNSDDVALDPSKSTGLLCLPLDSVFLVYDVGKSQCQCRFI